MTTLLAHGRRAGEGGQPSDYALEVRFRRPAAFPRDTVSFPCDPHGHVDLNALNDATRRDYLFARALARLGQAEFWFARERSEGCVRIGSASEAAAMPRR
ncbi:MAG: hypothetical protein KIT17_02030 [Rubrivivax sp.]|jgi:hypothetical protein|nr:hypothetical protein [Burkholderiales bacterium]MCW5632088.1 hypothetical protein [Rubrivivax sp.]